MGFDFWISLHAGVVLCSRSFARLRQEVERGRIAAVIDPRLRAANRAKDMTAHPDRVIQI